MYEKEIYEIKGMSHCLGRNTLLTQYVAFHWSVSYSVRECCMELCAHRAPSASPRLHMAWMLLCCMFMFDAVWIHLYFGWSKIRCGDANFYFIFVVRCVCVIQDHQISPIILWTSYSMQWLINMSLYCDIILLITYIGLKWFAFAKLCVTLFFLTGKRNWHKWRIWHIF